MPDRRSPTGQPFPPLRAEIARADYARRIRYFDQAIRQNGYKAIVTPALPCPCVVAPKDGGTGMPELRCPGCFGQARIYQREREVETRAVVQSVVMDPRPLLPQGMLELGTLQASFLGGTTLAYWDRVLFPDVLIRSSDYRRLTPPSQRLRLTFEPESIEHVLTRNPSSRTVRVLSAEQGDYSLDSESNELIISSSAQDFAPDMNISVLYRCAPYYYVIDSPHEFRGSFVKRELPAEVFVRLPVQVLLRRADLVEVKSGVGEAG